MDFVPDRVPDLEEPNTFPELLESLKVEFKGINELTALKDQLLSKPEWNNPNSKNFNSLRIEAHNMSAVLVKQIKIMSRGLRALMLINEKLDDAVRNSAT